jgi:predicted nucleic acid-binding protein
MQHATFELPQAGRTAPPNDILIAACAQYHGLRIEHDDAHFTLLAGLPPGR